MYGELGKAAPSSQALVLTLVISRAGFSCLTTWSMKATAIALDGTGRGQHEQGPALAEREQPDDDQHGQQHGGELAQADEEALDAVREACEQSEDGDVEVEDRLLGRDPERQGQEDDQRGDEQADDEDRRALVLRRAAAR